MILFKRMRKFETGVLVVQSLSHSEEAVIRDTSELVCHVTHSHFNNPLLGFNQLILHILCYTSIDTCIWVSNSEWLKSSVPSILVSEQTFPLCFMFYSYHLIVIILVAGKTEGPPQCPGVIQVGQRTFDYACCREVCSTWLFFSSLGISLLVPGCLCLRELVICAEMTRLKDFSSIQTDFWNLHNINTHSAFGGHVLVVIGMVETFHIKRLESVLILLRSHATSVNSEVCSD